MGTVCLSARHLVGGILADSSKSVRCEVHINKNVNNPNPSPILFPLVPPVKKDYMIKSPSPLMVMNLSEKFSFHNVL